MNGTRQYVRGLVAARDLNRAIGRRSVDLIMASFAQMLDRLAGDHHTRADVLAREVKLLILHFEREFAAATAAGVELSVSRILEIHDTATARISQAVTGRAIRLDYAKLTPVVYAQLAVRRGSAEFRSLLARRIRQDVFPVIDKVITSAAASGVGPGTLSREIAQILAADNPALLAHLPSRSTLHRGVGQINYARLGVAPADVAPLRSLLYDARRIAVSEVNNSLREANAVAMVESPLVSAAQWQLSGRHHDPDECDVLADTDFYGLGPGFYPPDAFPAAPHPHCGCYQGSVQIRPPSEWDKPKPRSGPPVVDPRAPAVYNKWSEDWTDKRARRARRVVATVIGETTPLRRLSA